MKVFESFAIVFLHNNTEYRIGVVPLTKTGNDIPTSFEIIIEGVFKGVICCINNKWTSHDIEDEVLVRLLGKCIREVYEKKDKILEMTSQKSFSLN